MYRGLFLSAALALATSSALGADLPAKTYQPMAVPAPTWAGFYFGVDAGVTLDAPINFSTATELTKIDPRGGTFGGHAGFNFQTGKFVYGVEVFAAWNGNSKTLQLDPGVALDAKIDYLGSATAKLGLLLFGDDVLVYAKGGLGFAHTSATVTETSVVEAVSIITRATAFQVSYGPVVGAGLEWRILGSQNWLLRADYQHFMLGNNTFSFAGGVQANVNASQKVDIITAGLSYKFSP